jgi:hypothetical protein
MNNQSAGASSLLLSQAKNGLETTFNNGNNHQGQNGTDKRFNQSDFEMRTREFQERKLKKIAALKDEKNSKAVEECTFVPNSSVIHSQITGSKSQGKLINQSISINHRNTYQFLEDQKKKEEERLMKISLQIELSLLKET